MSLEGHRNAIFGYHGEISPENVLWFVKLGRKYDRASWWTLKLSDDGLAKFSIHQTRPMTPGFQMGGWSISYPISIGLDQNANKHRSHRHIAGIIQEVSDKSLKDYPTIFANSLTNPLKGSRVAIQGRQRKNWQKMAIANSFTTSSIPRKDANLSQTKRYCNTSVRSTSRRQLSLSVTESTRLGTNYPSYSTIWLQRCRRWSRRSFRPSLRRFISIRKP